MPKNVLHGCLKSIEMSSKLVLVTGGSGFVGKSLLKALSAESRYSLVTAVRGQLPPSLSAVRSVVVGNLDADTNWRDALKGISIVVHLAARVHVMHESDGDPLSAFRKVNVHGTMNLARMAASAGVKRFIFISTIKVNGEQSRQGKPYTADDVPSPADPYGVSKLEAEQGLRDLADRTGMEVVIIRPALIYGPGVKANFLNMMRWLHRGVPLPFGGLHNRRSLLALENLIDLIITCLEHRAAANQIFLASDGEDVSTSDLLRRLALALGKPARLLAVPSWLIQGVFILLGRRNVSHRLFGSLQVDICKNQKLLGWTPPVSLDQGLRLAAQHFLESHKP